MLRCCMDELTGLSAAYRETGAQRFMSRNQFINRRLQRLCVQFALERQRQRHVVRGADAFKLIEEPQTLLRER